MTRLDLIDQAELAARVADEVSRVASQSGLDLPLVQVSVAQESDCSLTVSVQASGLAIEELCQLLIVTARSEILEDIGLHETCVTFEIRPEKEP